MSISNPFPIQTPPVRGNVSDVPLVLIHDGGGTIFSYTMIGDLDREVYGIHNPRYYTGGLYEGGIAQMAEEYTQMIRKLIPKGPLLLGGWSMGGILSVQVAHNLARDVGSQRQVIGIVMIDSPCPLSWKRPAKIVPAAPSFASTTSDDTRNRVVQCMKSAGNMLETWDLPAWNHETEELPPPPTVLIRCREYVPTPAGSDPDAVCRVDVARREKDLGWTEYWRPNDFRSALLETDSHHYNVFSFENLDGVSEEIYKACRILVDGELSSPRGNFGGVQVRP